MSRVFVVEHAVAGLEPGARATEEELAGLQIDALLIGGFLTETATYESSVNQGLSTMTESPVPEPTTPEPEPQPEPEPEPAAPEGA